MLRNYFLIAVRNLWRNKAFSLINILGLSIGISAALVIFLVVQYDFSFDRFHKDGDRIYRVVSDMHFPDQEFKNSGVCGPLTGMIRNQVPGIEESTAFWTIDNIQVDIPSSVKEKKTFKKQPKVMYADEHFFRMFNYQWLAGSPREAPNGPGKTVLTESRARAYFPGSDYSKIIGQTVIYNDTIQTTVTGIVKEFDQPTDFIFKEFISLATYKSSLEARNGYGQWGSISSSSQFFIKLAKNSKAAEIAKLITKTRAAQKKDDYLKTDNDLQPLSDIHFNATYDAFEQRIASKKVLFGLIAVATFLLLLGCINFINLTTAQSSKRAREIGIRKTMGSSAWQLIMQFLGETFLLTLLATFISILLAPWIMKLFSGFIPEGLTFAALVQPKMLVFVLALIILVSILSGLYPSIIVTKFQPAVVLKNLTFNQRGQSRKAWMRKILTVSQFAIAQFFIIATLVVGQQIRYSVNMDMGFQKEAIINFSTPLDFYKLDHKAAELQEKLKGIPGIHKISLAGDAPASNGTMMTTFKLNKDGKDIETTVELKYADTAYINLYGLKVLAGRNLRQSDTTTEYLVNEAYARFLGYRHPADVVGKYIEQGKNQRIPIVGLVSDFHTHSTQAAMGPLALTCQANYHNRFNILLSAKGKNTDGWKNTIASIEKSWKQIYPDQDFSYEFLDDAISKFYTQEQQTARLLNWSAGLAVLISCLGLLGLIIFTTTQRIKEIGVRKVLGATIPQIVSLLSWDSLKLVIVAFLLASPLAWWAMHSWLQNYTYRTGLNWWIFASTGLGMFMIAFLTLSIQTVRSASDNPVNSLRSE